MCKTLTIKTDSVHKISVVVTGDTSKIPVVVLHGGPGSKSKPKHVKNFDFDKVYTIQIDQRGCGESTPQGSIENNTTEDLLNDIEQIREELNVEKWVVSGASWGSTLALLYAEKHPEKVLGLFIGSIFQARKRDTDWLLREGGATRFFPDVWEKVQEKMKEHNIPTSNLYEHVYEVLKGDDFEKQQIVTSVVASWEGNLMSLDTNFSFPKPEEITEDDVNSTRVFVHYDMNNYFIEENQILNNIDKIKDIPTVIIHGRFDVVCPPEQAYLIHNSLNNSIIEFTSHDGHQLGSNAQIVKKYLFEKLLEKLEDN